MLVNGMSRVLLLANRKTVKQDEGRKTVSHMAGRSKMNKKLPDITQTGCCWMLVYPPCPAPKKYRKYGKYFISFQLWQPSNDRRVMAAKINNKITNILFGLYLVEIYKLLMLFIIYKYITIIIIIIICHYYLKLCLFIIHFLLLTTC